MQKLSTRYIWERYNVEYSLHQDGYGYNDYEVDYRGSELTVEIGRSCELDGSEIVILNPSTRVLENGRSLGLNGGDYIKLIEVDKVYWTGYDSIIISPGSVELKSGQITVEHVSEITAEPSRGTLQGYNSSSNSRAYPQGGVSGDYWYEYQGSDNIDAASVGYSTLEPRGGEAITINVTPSSGKVYSGTVSYLYQVQLDGGAWTTIATTTATSQSYTIPKGTQTFAARVRAQDNIGFTSSTYTTGATVTVKNSNAFVGVGGVVRNVEPRVCVNGVIYTNVTSYVCVDGVIRQS